MGSVMGSILDPTADKLLVTTLTITLALNGSLPGSHLPSACYPEALQSCFLLVWLATLIIGRDVGLGLSAFYWCYITLAPPVCNPFPIFGSLLDLTPHRNRQTENLSKILGFLDSFSRGQTNSIVQVQYVLAVVLDGFNRLESAGRFRDPALAVTVGRHRHAEVVHMLS